MNIQTTATATSGDLLVRLWGEAHVGAFSLPGRPGFVLPTDQPGIVLVGCEKSVGTFDLKTGKWQPWAALPDDNPRTIINDAEVVPGGDAVVFGTKDTKFLDSIAHLYLFTPHDRRVTILAEGQLCSNGKVIVREDHGLVLYDIDTPRKVVTRYRLNIEKRTIADEGIAVDLRHRSDFPDGMCHGGDGTVVVAFYNPEYAEAGEACRYRLDTGALVERWTTPGSPRVTCPLLVERPSGVQLLLTTATEGMPADMRAKCPNAGSLFLAGTNFTSVPRADVVRWSV